MATTLTGTQVADLGLTGWVYLVGALRTRVATGDFTGGLALVQAIGAAAEEADHHPDLDLRYDRVDVRLHSHDADGVTQRDVDLARTISRLVTEAGLTHDGSALQSVELALDSPDAAAILPFWGAFLDYERRPGTDDEVRDPTGAHPTLWVQASGADEPRQRWHLDVWVDPSRVQSRIDAAVAAGGRVVDDSAAPSFWVLADAEGNRSCLCTWQDREAGE
ncbi:4a-hydroxytetrahydrobiopterin dehydratase [Cellulomonas sp. S1-8]|uniref:4a-hydroxytetrahydrobiopterin dehydratase n=1 Tax=Cellulomonas sp. S1-8 TaxID=2904790 RepID=UPI0022436EBF|nr:4a-hydroxytetrahydrobiopterin dehydratase [Cellulomonas sp. S1-8]UZN04376.1 4a-hydroxytetrahydrobiopterin dehydratase [Cellulomonas sp. S1-8]